MQLGLPMLLLVVSCKGPQVAAVPREATGHTQESWFADRAAALGLTLEQARARDAALAEHAPPEVGSDAGLLAIEGAALWQTMCAPCHGLKGDLAGVDVAGFEVKPRNWSGVGPSFGFFFGGDKMRAGIYRSIKDGKGQMPAFGAILAREQVWALVRHIEGL